MSYLDLKGHALRGGARGGEGYARAREESDEKGKEGKERQRREKTLRNKFVVMTLYGNLKGSSFTLSKVNLLLSNMLVSIVQLLYSTERRKQQ